MIEQSGKYGEPRRAAEDAENARTMELVEAVLAADPLERDHDDVWGVIYTLAAEIKAEQGGGE